MWLKVDLQADFALFFFFGGQTKQLLFYLFHTNLVQEFFIQVWAALEPLYELGVYWITFLLDGVVLQNSKADIYLCKSGVGEGLVWRGYRGQFWSV